MPGEGVKLKAGRPVWLAVIALLGVFGSVPAPAVHEAGSSEKSELCPDSNALEHMVSGICWDCIFPMYVGGIEISGKRGKKSSFGGTANDAISGCYYCSGSGGGQISTGPASGDSGSNILSGKAWHNAGVPDGAVKKALCSCQEGALKKPGISESMWEPARLLEFPYRAGCFPALGGLYMGGAFDFLDMGSQGRPNTLYRKTNVEPAIPEFRFAHLYAFPVMQMAGMMTSAVCTKDAYVDFDMLHMAELDPTWKDKGIAGVVTPEVILISAMNVAAEIGCLPETVKTTLNNTPMDSLFWCAGNWGGYYPLVGHVTGRGAGVTSSYLMVRTMASLHRSGREFGTLGKANACGAKITEYLPKSQYKAQFFSPTTEKGSHVFGFPFVAWDIATSYPTPKGEVPAYILYRWNDCCNVDIATGGSGK